MPIYSHKHGGTPSPFNTRESHLEGDSAWADCLEVGIQVPHSCFEVTTPTTRTIYAAYVQHRHLKRTDGVFNTNTDVDILGGS